MSQTKQRALTRQTSTSFRMMPVHLLHSAVDGVRVTPWILQEAGAKCSRRKPLGRELQQLPRHRIRRPEVVSSALCFSGVSSGCSNKHIFKRRYINHGFVDAAVDLSHTIKWKMERGGGVDPTSPLKLPTSICVPVIMPHFTLIERRFDCESLSLHLSLVTTSSSEAVIS